MYGFTVRLLALLLSLLFIFAEKTDADSRLIAKIDTDRVSSLAGWQNFVSDYEIQFDISIQPLFSELSASSLFADSFDRSRYQVIIVSDSTQTDLIENQLQNSGLFEWIEPDYPLMLFSVPNDSLFRLQWYLENTGQQYYGVDRYDGSENDTLRLKSGTAGVDIKYVPARDKTGVKTRPLVAISDTGLDTKHPDIAPNLWHNPGEIADNGIDDDRNGYVDDVTGWDFSGDDLQFVDIVGDNDPMDTVGHGTHVAGIACAVSDNEIGIAGVATNAEVVGLKIFPNAYTSISSRSILYAVDMGADVINMSWGSYYPSQVLQDVLNYAHDQGVVLVAAVGNFGDSAKTYPAAFDVTITVGASNSDGEVTYFSSYGSWLDLIAPGLDILSLRADSTDLYAASGEPDLRVIDDIYYLSDGSSMSAPMVTGAVAEMLSYSPGLSPDRVREILRLSADDVLDPYDEGENLPGHDVFSGFGILNLYSALELTEGRLAKLQIPGRLMVTGELDIVGTAYSEFSQDYNLYVFPASDTTQVAPIKTANANVIGDTLLSYSDWGKDGKYIIRLEVGENIDEREVYYTSAPLLEINQPLPGDTIQGEIALHGTAIAPNFESFAVEMYPQGNPSNRKTIIQSSGFVSDSLLGRAFIGQETDGNYTFVLTMNAGGEEYSLDLSLVVSQGLAKGYPVKMKDLLDYAPAIYDIDGNGYQDVVVTSRQGIKAFNQIGGYVPGRWRFIAEGDYQGPPAVYDIDNDGFGEIAFVSSDGLHLYSHGGYEMKGFPKDVPVDKAQNGYPTVFFDDLDNDGYYEIIYVSLEGEIFAYRHDGTSYFASLDGFFAEVTGFVREYLPFVFCDDFNRDGQKEMIVVMNDAVSILNTRNGIEPDWIDKSLIATPDGVSGACMADFDGDSVAELGIVGRESTEELIFIEIMEVDGTLLDGFPKYLDRSNYLVNYPAPADLDFDGKAELVFTISSFDYAEIWVVRSDATIWGKPGVVGESWLANFIGSAGAPIVADINGDSLLDIIVRGGNFFPGQNAERIYAFDLSGQVIEGWPKYTSADPFNVFYRLNIPAMCNFGQGMAGQKADVLMTSDAFSTYAWELPVNYTDMLISWGQFAHDSRNSGILPPTPADQIVVPPGNDGEQSPPKPVGFQLAQNYPNPFNAETSISFRLLRSGYVEISVYNILGRQVNALLQGVMDAGQHSISWDGRDQNGDPVASGLYFYRLSTAEGTLSRKMILLK